MRERRRPAALWPLCLTLGIVVALSIRVGLLWSELPETMASHFGMRGHANAFMSKQGFFLFMLVVGGGSVAMLFASPQLLRILPPELINLPYRDYWLADDVRREIAIERITGLLGWMGAITTVLLAVALELALRANLHQAPFDNGVFLVFLALYFVLVMAGLGWMMHTLKLPEQND